MLIREKSCIFARFLYASGLVSIATLAPLELLEPYLIPQLCCPSPMTNKELYHQLCQSESSIPLFMQDWWMDAVCAGKQWDVLLSYDSAGNVQAALPYLVRKRAWLKYIVMPQQTQIGGIWIHPDLQLHHTEVMQVCKDLNQQLESLHLAYYYQHYPIGSSAIEPLKALNFKVRERVTYRIDDLSNLEAVVAAFSKNKKRQLQKALSLHADRNLCVEDFYRFHTDCLQQQGKQISYSREFLLVLNRKTTRLQQSQIIAIRNANNELLAAAFLVWDKQSLYYLIPCYSEQHKDSGASALLVLEAIKLAREKGVQFDFEGSMIRGVANHYKQFGSTRTIYYSVEKYYKWYFWFANVYNWLRERKIR